MSECVLKALACRGLRVGPSINTKSCPQLSTMAYDCRHFVTKVPVRKGPKKATKVHNIVCKLQVKPPFESPHLDFPRRFERFWLSEIRFRWFLSGKGFSVSVLL